MLWLFPVVLPSRTLLPNACAVSIELSPSIILLDTLMGQFIQWSDGASDWRGDLTSGTGSALSFESTLEPVHVDSHATAMWHVTAAVGCCTSDICAAWPWLFDSLILPLSLPRLSETPESKTALDVTMDKALIESQRMHAWPT